MKRDILDGRRIRIRLRWIVLAFAMLAAAPVTIHFIDWAKAVRLANSSAGSAAFHLAGARFMGSEWRPAEIDPRIVSATIQQPPRSGAYAGYAHAIHAEIVVEWRPLFSRFVGGPYPIRGRATAAVLRDRDGKWMPVMVE